MLLTDAVHAFLTALHLDLQSRSNFVFLCCTFEIPFVVLRNWIVRCLLLFCTKMTYCARFVLVLHRMPDSFNGNVSVHTDFVAACFCANLDEQKTEKEIFRLSLLPRHTILNSLDSHA